jgi:hypothetical protein
MVLRPFQFPVQTLPKISDEKGQTRVAFLYPNHFKNFLFIPDPNEKSGREALKTKNIKSFNKPIPVLLPDEYLENYSESNVTLTGVVSAFSDDLIDLFSKSICDIRQDFFSGFFRPYSNKMAFCLDCREEINTDFVVNEKLESLPAAIYVEGHFEGASGDKYEEQYITSIPQRLPLKGIRYEKHPDMTYCFTEHDEVSIMSFKSNTFGFYTITDLVNEKKMHHRIESLRDFYREFYKKSCSAIRREHGDEVRFKPDFVFDYRKQFLFHPDGVLDSFESRQVISEHPEIEETISWVKNEN